MAIKVPAQYQRRMEEMAGNTSQNLLSDPIHFRGKIRKLDGEEYAAFREYFQDAGWSDQEIEDMTLPYYISAYDGTNSMDGAYVILFFLGVGLLIWGIVRLIKVFTGSYLKGMRKTIEASGYTESQIETDYRNAVSALILCGNLDGHIPVILSIVVAGPDDIVIMGCPCLVCLAVLLIFIHKVAEIRLYIHLHQLGADLLRLQLHEVRVTGKDIVDIHGVPQGQYEAAAD